MSKSLLGKTAIVTGSSRGIGKAIALELGERGANVAVCARSQQSTKQLPGSIGQTVDEIRARGGRALAIKVDVVNDDEVRRMIECVLGTFGAIDILVNNAALAGLAGPGKPFVESNASLLDAFYRTNVRAPYVISSLAARAMADRGGGVIVNISSGMAKIPSTASVPIARSARNINMGYAIAKAALDRFSAAIAAELLPQRVAVVTVVPALTKLERLAQRNDPDQAVADGPEFTARAVAFVCERSMEFTGQFLTTRDLRDAERRARPID